MLFASHSSGGVRVCITFEWWCSSLHNIRVVVFEFASHSSGGVRITFEWWLSLHTIRVVVLRVRGHESDTSQYLRVSE